MPTRRPRARASCCWREFESLRVRPQLHAQHAPHQPALHRVPQAGSGFTASHVAALALERPRSSPIRPPHCPRASLAHCSAPAAEPPPHHRAATQPDRAGQSRRGMHSHARLRLETVGYQGRLAPAPPLRRPAATGHCSRSPSTSRPPRSALPALPTAVWQVSRLPPRLMVGTSPKTRVARPLIRLGAPL